MCNFAVSIPSGQLQSTVKAVSLCLHCATMDVSPVLAGAALGATSKDL